MLLYDWKTEKGEKYFFSNFVLEDWKTRKTTKTKNKKVGPRERERERESQAQKKKKHYFVKNLIGSTQLIFSSGLKKTLFLLGPSTGKNEIYEPNF